MLPLKFLESWYGYQPHPESYADPSLLSLVAEEDFSRLTMETIVQHDACNAPIRVEGMELLPRTSEPSSGPTSVVMEAMRSQYLGQAYMPPEYEYHGQCYGAYNRLYDAHGIKCYPEVATPGYFTVPNLLEYYDEVEGNKCLERESLDESYVSEYEDEEEEYPREFYGGGVEE
jgi:hypothetical protein